MRTPFTAGGPIRLRLLLATALLELLWLPASSWALMPPHATSVTPADGGVLVGRAILIEGYSLSWADLESQLKLVDAASGEAVCWTHDMTCRDERRCDALAPPGSCQERCELVITVESPAPGQRLKLTFMDDEVTFTVSPAPPPHGR